MTLNDVLKMNDAAAHGTSHAKMSAAMYTLQGWLDDNPEYVVMPEDFAGLSKEFCTGLLKSFLFATKHILDNDESL